MEREARTKAILELNDKINEYVHEKKLFAGGCCFSAYILADIFTRMGINYDVILFQSYETAEEKDFNNAIYECCDHVAIDVRIGKRHLTIGDYSKITDFYGKYNIAHSMRRYKGIKPYELKKAYYENDWNETYDTRNNLFLRGDLYAIAYKYGHRFVGHKFVAETRNMAA